MLKSRLRSAVSGLVDQTVAYRGKAGLERYLRIVKSLAPDGSAQARRHRIRLAYLPSARAATIPIAARPAAFLYMTDTTDDLLLPARLDFDHWEPVTRRLYFLLACEAQGVLDIGAYSGVFAMTAARASDSSVIWAFEPNPVMNSRVADNVELNGLSSRVTVLDAALSDQSGSGTLFQHVDNRGTSLASLIGSGEASVLVRLATLDEFEFSRPISLIKIDAEGVEASVYRGGMSLLCRDRPVIISEALTDDDLRTQRDTLKSAHYGEPIQVLRDGPHGDSRNYAWATPENAERLESALDLARTHACSCRRSPS